MAITYDCKRNQVYSIKVEGAHDESLPFRPS